MSDTIDSGNDFVAALRRLTDMPAVILNHGQLALRYEEIQRLLADPSRAPRPERQVKAEALREFAVDVGLVDELNADGAQLAISNVVLAAYAKAQVLHPDGA